MVREHERIAALLRAPETVRALGLRDWDIVVRQARAAGLLARLHGLLAEHGLVDAVPPAPLSHLAAAHTLALKHGRDVRWEVECITAALSGVVDRVVLLKGAAYLMADLPPARGR